MKWIGWILLVAALGLAGCRSDKEVEKAFQRGRIEGMLEAMPKKPVVFVRGQVAHPVVPWVEGLTLAEALVQADYLGFQGPRQIVVIRAGMPHEIDPKQLLHGRINPRVEPGDIIELRY